MGLDLKAHLARFQGLCKAKFGRTYDFSAIERHFAPLQQKGRLGAKDVSYIFHEENTPFGEYWSQPNKKYLDKELSLKRVSLSLDRHDRGTLVKNLLSVFPDLFVASIILRFTHPKCFGVFSTDILYLLPIIKPNRVALYLAYCDELLAWKEHFEMSSVAETEMAIASLSETIEYVDSNKEATAANKSFEDDLWVQRRRATLVVGPFLRRYGNLQLARIILGEGPRLAGKIAGEEYERLLGEASKRFRKYEMPARTGAALELIDELVQRRIISLPEKHELHLVWETRMQPCIPATHPLPKRSAT